MDKSTEQRGQGAPRDSSASVQARSAPIETVLSNGNIYVVSATGDPNAKRYLTDGPGKNGFTCIENVDSTHGDKQPFRPKESRFPFDQTKSVKKVAENIVARIGIKEEFGITHPDLPHVKIDRRLLHARTAAGREDLGLAPEKADRADAAYGPHSFCKHIEDSVYQNLVTVSLKRIGETQSPLTEDDQLKEGERLKEELRKAVGEKILDTEALGFVEHELHHGLAPGMLVIDEVFKSLVATVNSIINDYHSYIADPDSPMNYSETITRSIERTKGGQVIDEGADLDGFFGKIKITRNQDGELIERWEGSGKKPAGNEAERELTENSDSKRKPIDREWILSRLTRFVDQINGIGVVKSFWGENNEGLKFRSFIESFVDHGDIDGSRIVVEFEDEETQAAAGRKAPKIIKAEVIVGAFRGGTHSSGHPA